MPLKKKQKNRHLSSGGYGNGGGGAGSITNNSSTNNGKKSGAKKGSQPQSTPHDKASWQQPKPAIKAEGIYINKNKERGQPQGKKAHFDPEVYESE